MPGGDGTGPAGMGPMTGRAAGYCAGYPVPGLMNPIPGRGYGGWGRGMGWGRGRGGRGRRNWFYATGMPGWERFNAGYPAWGSASYGAWGAYGPAQMTAEQELEALKSQAQFMEEGLSDIRKRMSEVETEAKKK
jgi:hypothetical protein